MALCKATGLKFQRPDDYYADMLKTDDHMLKLKDHLLAEKKRKDDRTKLVKERQMKKFAKKVRFHSVLAFFFAALAYIGCQMMTIQNNGNLSETTCREMFF